MVLENSLEVVLQEFRDASTALENKHGDYWSSPR